MIQRLFRHCWRHPNGSPSQIARSEVIVRRPPRTLQRSRLNYAVPRAGLPVVFVALRVDPRRQGHQEPATEGVKIRFVEHAKFRQPIGRIRDIIARTTWARSTAACRAMANVSLAWSGWMPSTPAVTSDVTSSITVSALNHD